MTNVTANSPIFVTNATTTPNISLGVVPAQNGGTGLNSAGAAGNFLRSSGGGWLSMPLLSIDLPPGSSKYIQNGTDIQSLANFNINGTGKVGTLDAQQINLLGVRVLRRVGINNFSAGPFSGSSLTTGLGNSFFGTSAGSFTETGNDNAYFGLNAGIFATGSGNTFFGANAGGGSTGNASDNTFIGRDTDFLGALRTGDHNTLLGANAKLDQIGVNPLKYATAIGAGARAQFSDMVIIGKEAGTYDGVARPADIVRIPGILQMGLGTTGGSPLCYNNGISLCPPSLPGAEPIPPLIVKSPNGTCFLLLVNDAGVMLTAVTTCP